METEKKKPIEKFVRMGMSREKNLYLVRELFTAREANIVTHALAALFARAESANAKGGLSNGVTQGSYDDMQGTTLKAMGKVWSALPPENQLALQKLILEQYNINLEVSQIEEPRAKAPTAVQ